MTLTRRDFLLATLGVILGGAVATGAGLGFYYWRKRALPRPRRVIMAGTDEWVLTEGDAEILELQDTVAETETFEILKNRDIVGGGDYKMVKVSDLGECVEICAADQQCNAFSYGRLSHGNPAKRRSCYLKSERGSDRISETTSYVSGIRK